MNARVNMFQKYFASGKMPRFKNDPRNPKTKPIPKTTAPTKKKQASPTMRKRKFSEPTTPFSVRSGSPKSPSRIRFSSSFGPTSPLAKST